MTRGDVLAVGDETRSGSRLWLEAAPSSAVRRLAQRPAGLAPFLVCSSLTILLCTDYQRGSRSRGAVIGQPLASSAKSAEPATRTSNCAVRGFSKDRRFRQHWGWHIYDDTTSTGPGNPICQTASAALTTE